MASEIVSSCGSCLDPAHPFALVLEEVELAPFLGGREIDLGQGNTRMVKEEGPVQLF
jgi:hypothetical protein